MMLALACSALVLAALPAVMFLANRRHYQPLPRGVPSDLPLSVLIPARNEEGVIGDALAAVAVNPGANVEIIVLDDHSTDATAAIVRDWSARDPRIRLASAPELPPGWCGKQHACHQLALLAQHPILVFLDADVRLMPDALPRLSAYMAHENVDLASGFPRQRTVTLGEQLAIPLIHFLLLGFLPMARMKQFPTTPAYAAGCGQLFVARRDRYFQMGGHATIKTSLHDGIKLPRAFRAAGLTTALFDATDLAVCRMYGTTGEVWRGLAKNATEGLANPRLILPASLLLFGGQVLPFVLLACWPWLDSLTAGVALAAAILAYLPRILGVIWFHQPVLGALLHPIGVLMVLAIQWYALGRKLLGLQAGWKGRTYAAQGSG
jgi:hypothetical protein